MTVLSCFLVAFDCLMIVISIMVNLSFYFEELLHFFLSSLSC